jgi:hypothetical protein
METALRIVLITNLLGLSLAVGSEYTSVGAGPCRGNGGSTDKVNSKYMNNVATETACEAYCDAESTCAGFAYETGGDSACIIYGPGMSGSCASPNEAQTSPTSCTAVGSCNDPSDASSEIYCGSCSDTDAVRSDSCSSMSATWTAATWTGSGVWEEPEGGWTAEYFTTDHIHAVSSNTNWACYDKDIGDHVGRCTDGSDTPSDTDCVSTFQGADTFEEASCPTAAPENCVWTAAPTEAAEKPAHPDYSDHEVEGYTGHSGACRSTSAANKADADATKGQDRPPYAYKKNADFPTFPTDTSPAELAALCDSIDGCLGFHSGPWMSLFGVGMDETPPDDTWVGSAGQEDTTTLETTKPNHQYICYIKDSAGCGPGCIGGIVGGCFVPTLLFILWIGGAFGNKCPSPCAKKGSPKFTEGGAGAA